jgi:LemA protein
MGTGLIIVLVVVGVIVLWAVMTYNGLVSRRARVDESWSGIDVQLKRRTDLIPNLVETVKGYAAHERETLEAVTAARNMAVGANTPGEKAEADNVLTGTLKSLFAVSEAYPDLKANQNFLDLQEELTATEDKIAYSRQYYNDNVTRLNTKIETFPAMLFAGMAKATHREYFETAPEDRDPVKVEF